MKERILDFACIYTMKLAIWFLKRGYGEGCPDWSETCIQCQAGKVIRFLENDIELTKEFW